MGMSPKEVGFCDCFHKDFWSLALEERMLCSLVLSNSWQLTEAVPKRMNLYFFKYNGILGLEKKNREV